MVGTCDKHANEQVGEDDNDERLSSVQDLVRGVEKFRNRSNIKRRSGKKVRNRFHDEQENEKFYNRFSGHL